jgi:hypothetical protein
VTRPEKNVTRPEENCVTRSEENVTRPEENGVTRPEENSESDYISTNLLGKRLQR